VHYRGGLRAHGTNGKTAETRAIEFRDGLALFFAQTAGDGSHRQVDLVGARAGRKSSN